MNETLFAVLIAVAVVAGIGLLIGLVLSVASAVMAVPKDEKAEKILELLPGANCGACGYSGCEGYAKALAKGTAKPGLCSPGGEKCAKAIGGLLGVDGEVEKKVAVVKCMGSRDNTSDKALYQGVQSCLMASKTGNGLTSCLYGCIGLGDCTRVCPNNAISVCNGVAVVNDELCVGCKLCANACPRHIISIVPVKDQAVVRCSNTDKGAVARKACKSACIGCQKCVKVCEFGAVSVTNFCAHVDYTKCTYCKKCVENCPVGCITLI